MPRNKQASALCWVEMHLVLHFDIHDLHGNILNEVQLTWTGPSFEGIDFLAAWYKPLPEDRKAAAFSKKLREK